MEEATVVPNGESNGPPKLVTPELIELSKWLSDWIKVLRDTDKRHDERMDHAQSRIVQIEESIHRVDVFLNSLEEWKRMAQTYEQTWDELSEEVKLRGATINQSVNNLEIKIDTSVAHLTSVIGTVSKSIDKISADATAIAIAKLSRNEKVLVIAVPVVLAFIVTIISKLLGI